jgi:hypothetical protein
VATAVTTARTSPPARSIARTGLFTVAATIVFPAAAARGVADRYTVVKSLYATIAALGGVAVPVVYGADRRTAGLTWREPAPSVMATWFRQATRGGLGRA